jgi:hypothetical protein
MVHYSCGLGGKSPRVELLNGVRYLSRHCGLTKTGIDLAAGVCFLDVGWTACR